MKKTKGLFFLIIGGLLFSCSSALAAPSISGVSGTVSNGQNITISGSGFGTKSPAAPVMYSDFNANINPSNLGRITSWDELECFQYTSTGGVAGGGGTKTDQSCSVTAYGGMYVYTGGISFYPNALSQKFYIYRNRNKAYTGDVNLKSLESNKRGAYGTADLIYNHSSNQWITQGISPDSYFYVGSTPNNQWVAEELVAQTGASNGAQALSLSWYVNGTLKGSMASGQISLRDDSNNMDHVSVAYHGDYNAGGGGSMGLEYFDNLYLDDTWSRVILGNASTYSASTHFEIQVPSAWSNTSVSIKANQGSFSSGQQAYLYVIDSTGAVNSSGYSVTIGSGGSCTPTCSGKSCGDNGCGGSCGSCSASQTCTNYQCVTNSCTPNWACSVWSTCSNSSQTRTCTDGNNCGVNTGKPATTQSCVSAKTADLNGDKKVNIFDYTLFLSAFGKTGSNIADLNSDNKVDIFDYTLFVADFGKSF